MRTGRHGGDVCSSDTRSRAFCLASATTMRCFSSSSSWKHLMWFPAHLLFLLHSAKSQMWQFGWTENPKRQISLSQERENASALDAALIQFRAVKIRREAANSETTHIWVHTTVNAFISTDQSVLHWLMETMEINQCCRNTDIISLTPCVLLVKTQHLHLPQCNLSTVHLEIGVRYASGINEDEEQLQQFFNSN